MYICVALLKIVGVWSVPWCYLATLDTSVFMKNKFSGAAYISQFRTMKQVSHFIQSWSSTEL